MNTFLIMGFGLGKAVIVKTKKRIEIPHSRIENFQAKKEIRTADFGRQSVSVIYWINRQRMGTLFIPPNFARKRVGTALACTRFVEIHFVV
ncbi:hypothetical protein D3C86_2071110 [compost metagenome]